MLAIGNAALEVSKELLVEPGDDEGHGRTGGIFPVLAEMSTEAPPALVPRRLGQIDLLTDVGG